jgi:hypothetical protein
MVATIAFGSPGLPQRGPHDLTVLSQLQHRYAWGPPTRVVRPDREVWVPSAGLRAGTPPGFFVPSSLTAEAKA